MRGAAAGLLWGMVLAGSAVASGPGGAMPPAADVRAWQAVISAQIAAFRHNDAAGALKQAGASFQQRFSDPEVFMTAIAGAGYAPIFTSVSESFGAYQQPDADDALQQVELLGADQSLFEAVYALRREAGGWRIEGVTLARQPGLGV